MPATLVASELFGHERGAFTGADRRRAGAFERANGGTVFLDEIGELPLEVQPALLGVLERKRFRPLGSTNEVDVDVRVIAATHRDLRAGVNQAVFRADLYYRLAVAKIFLPPLRDRPEDVEPLVRHFVLELTGDPTLAPFGPEAMERLRAQPWGGNVRELRNVVENALAMGSAEETSLEYAAARDALADRGVEPYRKARAEVIARFESEYLARLIQLTGGNASEAARRAGMDRPYLLTLLRKHGLR
jgi:DNA-binding NtrC family response regulator